MRGERAAAVAAKVAARIGGALILLSAGLVGAEVLARNLGLPLRLHSFELTNYAFAAAIALGFAHAATTRSHIRIDVLYARLPLRVKALLDVAALLSLLLVAGGMAWQAWRVVAQSSRLGARPNSTLDIPLVLPQGIWAAGLSFFALIVLVLCVAACRRLLRRDWAALQQTAGPHAEEAPK